MSGHTASIAATSSALVTLEGVVEAKYGLWVDVDGAVTGLEIDGVQQSLIIKASSFAIESAGIIPFSVTGTDVRTARRLYIGGGDNMFLDAGTRTMITTSAGGSRAWCAVRTSVRHPT